MNSDWIDPGSFLAHQLDYTATGSAGRIVIRGLITSISRPLGVKPNLEDRVSGSEGLNKASFEQMKFVRLRLVICVGYTPGIGFCCFLIFERTTLLHRPHLSWLPNDAEVV